MDYIELANVTRHSSWDAFRAAIDGRLILLTTQAASSYVEIQYESDDILLLGRESAGVPPDVHDTVDLRVRIPIAESARSLNVALAGAMVLGEALRQSDGFPSQGIEAV